MNWLWESRVSLGPHHTSLKVCYCHKNLPFLLPCFFRHTLSSKLNLLVSLPGGLCLRIKSNSDSQITCLLGISSLKGNILEERGRERKLGRERVAVDVWRTQDLSWEGLRSRLREAGPWPWPTQHPQTHQRSNVALEAQGCLLAKVEVSLDGDV